MVSSKHQQWFIEKVAERAHIPEDDVPELVAEFLQALGSFTDQSAWNSVVDAVPIETGIQWEGFRKRQAATLEDFFLEMSDEEAVADGRAAEHARAVAQTVAEHAGPGGQERIKRAIKDEGLLALFESTRGELTSADAPTEGEKQRQEELDDSEPSSDG